MRGFIVGLVLGLVIGVMLALAGPQTSTRVNDKREAAGPEVKKAMGTTVSPVDWRLSGVFPDDMELSTNAQRIAARITGLTRDGVKISYLASGSQETGLELFNAVSSGTIEAGFSRPSYWSDKSRGFDLLAGLPFGPPGDEFLAWYHQGGGDALVSALFRRHNIQGILCGLSGAVPDGLFTMPVNSLNDFRNKSIAATGLSALVLRKTGAQVITKTWQEMAPSLRDGTLFGIIFPGPLILDQNILRTPAKHLYFPGWSQQISSYFLIIHLPEWNGLSKIAKTRIQAVCNENILHTFAHSEGTHFKRLKKMINHGAEVHEWPPETIASLMAIWAKESRRLSRYDRDFGRLWSSLKKFRRDFKIWKELGYL